MQLRQRRNTMQRSHRRSSPSPIRMRATSHGTSVPLKCLWIRSWYGIPRKRLQPCTKRCAVQGRFRKANDCHPSGIVVQRKRPPKQAENRQEVREWDDDDPQGVNTKAREIEVLHHKPLFFPFELDRTAKFLLLQKSLVFPGRSGVQRSTDAKGLSICCKGQRGRLDD
jgi:hypothetical protein